MRSRQQPLPIISAAPRSRVATLRKSVSTLALVIVVGAAAAPSAATASSTRAAVASNRCKRGYHLKARRVHGHRRLVCVRSARRRTHVAYPHAPAAPRNNVVPAVGPKTLPDVCALSPSVGTMTTGSVHGVDYAYWVNTAGAIDIMAFSIDGNSSVDAAAIVDDGRVVDVGLCSRGYWTTVAGAQRQAAYDPGALATYELLNDTAAKIAGLNNTGYGPDVPCVPVDNYTCLY